MRTCAQCGHATAPADLFCAQCGATLLERDLSDETFVDTVRSSGAFAPAGAGRVAGLAPGDAALIVQRGPGAGVHFGLDASKVTTAGRAQDADIFLDDVTVSRSHATIARAPEGWVISDSGSLNGTYVNRVRVDTHRLMAGDEVQIGKYRFVFVIGEDSTA
jgi:hypothetical protein